MIIRNAKTTDASEILDVYKWFIESSAVSFEIEVPTLAEFTARVESISNEYPYFVCEVDGKVVGYAYASRHHERAAYRFSADVSIYISSEYTSQGIGKKLYTALFNELAARGFYTIIAGITLPNERSVAIHESFGFKKIAHYTNIGYKMGSWLDVVYYEKALRDYDVPPIEPKFN